MVELIHNSSMAQKKTSELTKRFKALLWHAGTMAAIAAIAVVQEGLTDLEIPEWLIALLGITLAQITKYLNKQSSKAV